MGKAKILGSVDCSSAAIKEWQADERRRQARKQEIEEDKKFNLTIKRALLRAQGRE